MASRWRNGRRVAVLTALAALASLVLAGSAAASISLSSDSASLVVGQTVTLTANVQLVTGGPGQDRNVTFTVTSGPNAGLSQQAVSDANGNATFSYTSFAPGTDDITASWVNLQNTETSNDVTVTWSPAVTLSADNPFPLTGQTVTLTANVIGPNGLPAQDQTIVFTVATGPNAGLSGQAVTDANGNASFGYSSSTTGTDVVNAQWITGEQTSNDVSVTWSPPPPSSVTLSPASTSLVVGQTVTLTVNVQNPNGGQADEAVSFTVTSGPNAGLNAQATTDANGNASFSYSSNAIGTDIVSARWIRGDQASNDASVAWSALPQPSPPKTDVGIALSAPSLVRVGNTGTWTASVTNTGPDTATGVVVSARVSPGATFVSASESAGDGCTGSTCRVGTLAKGATVTVKLVYTLTQAGSPTVDSSVTGDFDTNSSNNAASASTTVLALDALPPPPPPPTQPGTFNALPTGTVLVNGATVPSDQLFVLKAGDTIDATNGVITFTAADGSTGNFSSTQPTARRSTASAGRAAADLPAQFSLSQGSDGVTTLTLAGGDFGSCGSARSLAANTKPVRGLWGSAKGNFRTNARFSSATVRGTIWFVEDRCDGSFTQVVQGTVAVRDTVRNKTVLVSAGSSYLAKSPLKIAAQTAALVARRGLRHDGKLFKTKKAFEVYLRRSGYTWAEFASRYPTLARALAKRK